MSKWIAVRNNGEQISMKTQEIQTENIPQIDGIDSEKGLIVTDQNVKLYLKILKKFSVNQENFKENFLDAIASKDINLAKRIAHTLKGVAGSIGATQLQEEAYKLENACQEVYVQERIFTLLAQVMQQLTPILKGLNAVSMQENQVQNNESMDTQTVLDKLQKMQQLAESFDIDALEELESLQKMQGLGKFQHIIERLDNALGDYDFSFANDIMQEFIELIEKET